MARTNCPGCGATVDIALIEDTEETIPLEIAPEVVGDADAYRIVGLNPLVVKKVAKDAAGTYFPDHRYDCPAFNAGR